MESSNTLAKRNSLSWWQIIFLEKSFHFRQIRRLLTITILIVIVSTTLLGVFYHSIIDHFISGDLPVYFMPEEMAAISAGLPGLQETMLKWGTIIMLTNISLTLILGIYITHKLGSPLCRFKLAAKDIADGQLYTHVEIPRSDEFKDLADELNNAIARVQLMIMAINENLRILENESSSLDDKNNAVKGCREALAYFETIEIEKL